MREPLRGWRCVVPLVTFVAATGLVGALSSPLSEARSSEPGATFAVPSAPVRFEAPPGGAITVDGVGRYAGAIEILPDSQGGLSIVNEVALEDYLAGLAEVPARWPLAALEAQAVAARTYAWYAMREGSWRARGFDICASDTCQVYRGQRRLAPLLARRWLRAVAETEGEVLAQGGQPILALYSSSSGGATRDSQDVFPGEESHPYLRGVPDPEDAVSPLHRWSVTFTRGEMDAILIRSGSLPAGAPLQAIAFEPASDGQPDRVLLTRADGGKLEVPADTFQHEVSRVAPQVFPGRFPSRGANGRRLPTTLPSSRLAFTLTRSDVVIEGSGFGHGVGMSQYGAKGKAQTGMSYQDILAAYYGGLRPQRVEDLPRTIRVGLVTGRRAIALHADRGTRLLAAGGGVVREGAQGPWNVNTAPDGLLHLEGPAAPPPAAPR